MTFSLYFAMGSNNHFVYEMTFGKWDWANRPLNVLASFAIKGAVKAWKTRTYPTPGATTILDSGAYSAWKSGEVVSLDGLCKEAATQDWDEVAALDVIGDPDASLANALEMKSRGLVVMPVFHYGEPWSILSSYKAEFGRIGLGGITSIGKTQKMKWVDQCFSRAYPAKFHGFGVGNKDMLLSFPFYSADSASWNSVHQYGRSSAVQGIDIPKLGREAAPEDREKHYDLRYEILHYLDMALEVEDRWASELLQFKSQKVLGVI